MQVPNKKKRDMREILREFQRIDQIYFEFEEEFITNISLTLTPFLPNLFTKNNLDVELKHFANQIFNIAESVIDKDESYPDYRLQEELERMKNLAQTQVNYGFTNEMVIKLKNIVKKIVVDYFNGIYALSADGFRLLETNVNYNTNVFLDWLEIQVDI